MPRFIYNLDTIESGSTLISVKTDRWPAWKVRHQTAVCVEPLPDSETAAICWSWCGCVAVGKQNIATKTWQQIKCVLKHLYWKQRPSQKINICLNTVVLILSPSSFQYVRQCSENIKIKNKVSGSMKLFYFTCNSI